MSRLVALGLLIATLGHPASADSLPPQGIIAHRPSPEPGDGGPPVLRLDHGGWRVRFSPGEMEARAVERAGGRLGVEVVVSPSATERLWTVTAVGGYGTVTIRICDEVVARPVTSEPINDGRLTILGAETSAEALIWVAMLSGEAPCGTGS